MSKIDSAPLNARPRKVEVGPDKRRATQRRENSAWPGRAAHDQFPDRSSRPLRFRPAFRQATRERSQQFPVAFRSHHLESPDATFNQACTVVLVRPLLCRTGQGGLPFYNWLYIPAPPAGQTILGRDTCGHPDPAMRLSSSDLSALEIDLARCQQLAKQEVQQGDAHEKRPLLIELTPSLRDTRHGGGGGIGRGRDGPIRRLNRGCPAAIPASGRPKVGSLFAKAPPSFSWVPSPSPARQPSAPSPGRLAAETSPERVPGAGGGPKANPLSTSR